MLLLADLYAPAATVQLGPPARTLYCREGLRALLARHGFALLRWEDCSGQLRQTVGQWILEHGRGGLEQALGPGYGRMKALGCGYYLAAARLSDGQEVAE